MEFNATFIVVLLSFVAFMVMMRQVFFEPIRQIKAAREAEMGHSTAEAEQLAQQLIDMEAAYKAQLAKARQQAQQTLAETRQQALTAAQQQRDAAKQQAQAQLDAHAAALAQQADALNAELANEREAFAHSIVAHLTTTNGSREAVPA